MARAKGWQFIIVLSHEQMWKVEGNASPSMYFYRNALIDMT